MTQDRIRAKLKKVPPEPGIYRFHDLAGRVLYIGKARNLRHRVPSYFLRSNLDRGPRIAQLIDNITDIDWEVTDSEIEALLLESRLIQEYKPKYNVEWRDDKTYLHLEIDTRAAFPTIRLIRKSQVGRNRRARYFGPYTSSRALKLAFKFIRRLLPYCEYSFLKGAGKSRIETSESTIHDSQFSSHWFKKPCLYYHLGLCPGICAGEISLEEYRRRIRQLVSFFEGHKQKVIRELEKEMEQLAKEEKYEQAARIRNSWEGLQHLREVSLLRGTFEEKTMAQRGAVPHRIEAYDVSNIFGNYAVGSMVVFVDGQPDKNEYKRFKIKTIPGISDVGALIEVLRRRLRHSELAYSRQPTAVSRQQSWPLPNLIMIDGGKGQLNAAIKVLTEFGAQIPVLAIAKGRQRKKADQYYYGYGKAPLEDQQLIRRLRDEAHRFAITYYRTLHRKGILAQ